MPLLTEGTRYRWYGTETDRRVVGSGQVLPREHKATGCRYPAPMTICCNHLVPPRGCFGGTFLPGSLYTCCRHCSMPRGIA